MLCQDVIREKHAAGGTTPQGASGDSPCKICPMVSVITPDCRDGKKHCSLRAKPMSTASSYYHFLERESEGAVLCVCEESEDKTRRLYRRDKYLAVIRTRGDKIWTTRKSCQAQSTTKSCFGTRVSIGRSTRSASKATHPAISLAFK